MAGRVIWSRPGWLILLVMFAVLLLFPFAVILQCFDRVDMLALAFHLDFGTEGAPLSAVSRELRSAFFGCLFIIIISHCLLKLWPGHRWIAFVLTAILLLTNPLSQYHLRALTVPYVDLNLSDDFSFPAAAPENPTYPDLVIIFLEGTDQRFFDRSVFGNTAGALDDLKAEALTFTNIKQIEGTGWSIAGMVATQCGTPLLPKGLQMRDDFKHVEHFLPGVTCLGDILERQNYALHYVVGGKLEFGGIDRFYRGHGFERLIGFDQLAELSDAKTFLRAQAKQIADDQLVFSAAQIEFSNLIVKANPFALVVETTGPHGLDGYLSRSCTSDGQSAQTEDVNATVRCTTELARAFVDTIRADYAKSGRSDLRIVILSDHLWHGGTTPGVDPVLEGRNTVMFLDKHRRGDENSRVGSMVDVFPTLLDWLDLAESPVAAGLGRSLLDTPQTLLERYDLDSVNANIISDPDLSRQIWSAQIKHPRRQ
ncbi:MAG: sulfatase-like hydrolase/transferase [Deltaproteobacteria bacterium]